MMVIGKIFNNFIIFYNRPIINFALDHSIYYQHFVVQNTTHKNVDLFTFINKLDR